MNDVLLGIVAAVLVVFALVMSMGVPRRFPDFPGRGMRMFALVTLVLVGGMLATVEVVGEGHEFGPGHGEEAAEAAVAEPGAAEEEAAPTEAAPPAGDVEAGKKVFDSAGCAACHTLTAANATGTVGPNLDETTFSFEKILAQVTNGSGAMPPFKGQLSDEQIENVSAFVFESAQGGGGGGEAPAETEAAPAQPSGDPAAGEKIFNSAGCAACHTLSAAGATGTVGPNLDELKPGFEQAVEQVTNGGGAMPPYKGQLSEKQIDDVSAYVVESTKGG